jgi:Phage-related lysozyme (muraminidase)
MPISERGLMLLRFLEGVRSHAYKDARGWLTIGCGHLLTRDELMSGKLRIGDRVVHWLEGLEPAQSEVLLRNDLAGVERAVARMHLLDQAQVDALCSFTFNVGIDAFQDSTLAQCLALQDYAAVPAQLRRWVYSGGKVIKGLQHRREAEVAMWEGHWTLPRRRRLLRVEG